MTDLEKKQQEYIEVYQVQTNNLLEENLVLEKRVEELEKALAHIYAWYPISVTQPRQTIDDIREFARAALGDQT